MDQYEINPPDGGYGWVVLGEFYTSFIFNCKTIFTCRISEHPAGKFKEFGDI